jgi:hypothetical protein
MLPVVGLPPQVTVQSTPALLTSLSGVMLNCAVVATASEVIPVVPLELVMEMEPALAEVEETELPPQPAIIIPSAVTQIAPQTKGIAFRGLRPEQTNFSDNTRVSIGNIPKVPYFFLPTVISLWGFP